MSYRAAVAAVLLLAGPRPGVAAPSGAAAPATGDAAIALLDADRAAGQLDEETYLLETFRTVFAPEKVSARYTPAQRTPLKCLTSRIARFERERESLSTAAAAEIDGYLRPARADLRAVYVSPSGRFSLSYSTTGANAVPSTDTTPANGIPDRVERCAEYLDTSWDEEITNLGFTPPNLPTDGTYDVFFQNMGAYGFTSIGGGIGQTTITLENDYVGFPGNSDPDGSRLGAAKVTCAHEFKHASQYATSVWTEGGWVELDATWMEDIVFDQTNDYYNYINFSTSQSQLSHPWLALDNGGTGSYEDCLWQHYLSEKHGNQIIVDLWTRRASFLGESMKASYQAVQQAYGTDWDQSWPEMYEWAWFTGSRSEPPYGFGEAPSYLRMKLRPGGALSTYPSHHSDSVDQISAHPYRFNPGTSGMAARIDFDGEDGHANFTVSVIVEDPTSFTIVRPALDANNVFSYTVPQAWDAITYVGVIVTNSKRSTGVKAYTLDVSEVAAATSANLVPGASAARVEMRPAAPNPFSTATDIAFSVPRAMHATVRILDVAGRTVRVLHDGAVPAGGGRVTWDGRNQAGRRVPAGVYWSRIETPEGSVARRIVALR